MTPISSIQSTPGVDKGILCLTPNVVIEPGYDGVFGKVKIWTEDGNGQKEEKEVFQEALF